MSSEIILYLVYAFISTTISSVIALLFWERRNSAGAKTLAWMMFFAAEWTFCDMLSDMSHNIAAKIFFDKLAYIGVIAIPVVWLIYSLQYTKHEKLLSFRNIIFLSVIPAASILVLFTNEYHHLFIFRIDFTEIGILSIITPTFGPWFWLHTAYSYILISIGTILIIVNFFKAPKIYRNQSLVMFLAAIFPFISNIAYIVGINPIYPADPTVFSFAASGFFFFIGMFKYKLLDLIPTARAAVIESMDELVVVLDNQNRVIDINPLARKVLGNGCSEMVGESIKNLLGTNSTHFEKYINTLKIHEKIVLDNGNGKKYYDFRISPLQEKNGKMSGRFAMLKDITKLEEAMEKLEESKVAAENANKAKSKFLATMSHEIRTPLNGIIGLSELLSSASLTDEEKGFLSSIQSSANSLLEIINDILDFSKIEAGKMELEKTSFNIQNLMEDTVRTFLYKAETKGVGLLLNMGESIPNTIYGDPVRLRQVLINLIGNALKFTEKGNVTVNLAKSGEDGSLINLRFSVSDTGIGIPTDKIDSLFKSFQQLDSSTTRKYGGTGLGLAIVKSLINMMGGEVVVKSRLGEGSTFEFTIPFKTIESSLSKPAKKETVPVFTGRNISILLAEDNKVNQILMVKLLEKNGIKVDVAVNGIQVLKMMEEKEYDLVLMDIQMPEMDGYEATLAIRSSELASGKHMPIIALTANATEQDRKMCMDSGMDDYLSKPIRSSKLFSCIEKFV